MQLLRRVSYLIILRFLDSVIVLGYKIDNKVKELRQNIKTIKNGKYFFFLEYFQTLRFLDSFTVLGYKFVNQLKELRVFITYCVFSITIENYYYRKRNSSFWRNFQTLRFWALLGIKLSTNY